eukprot:scaffold82_cov111-Cylindrotheca_fusiformis.AAC.2
MLKGGKVPKGGPDEGPPFGTKATPACKDWIFQSPIVCATHSTSARICFAASTQQDDVLLFYDTFGVSTSLNPQHVYTYLEARPRLKVPAKATSHQRNTTHPLYSIRFEIVAIDMVRASTDDSAPSRRGGNRRGREICEAAESETPGRGRNCKKHSTSGNVSRAGSSSSAAAQRREAKGGTKETRELNKEKREDANSGKKIALACCICLVTILVLILILILVVFKEKDGGSSGSLSVFASFATPKPTSRPSYPLPPALVSPSSGPSTESIPTPKPSPRPTYPLPPALGSPSSDPRSESIPTSKPTPRPTYPLPPALRSGASILP